MALATAYPGPEANALDQHHSLVFQ